MRGDDNYIPVAKFPKPKVVEQKRPPVHKIVNPVTSRKRSSIAEKIDQFHNERRKSTHQIEEKPRKKSHDEKEEVKEVPKVPKTPKIKKLPLVTSFRTLKKETIPERLKMGRCRTLSRNKNKFQVLFQFF